MLNTIAKYVSSLFPEEYSIKHLHQLQKILMDESLEITLATTNYDSVFETFFHKYAIEYDDGFTNASDIAFWKGFDRGKNSIDYLKLHGSFDWFKIPDDWFRQLPENLPINRIYKTKPQYLKKLLREDVLHEEKSKITQQLFSPHIIIGGVKDRKSLEIPFIEVQLLWQNAIHSAHTVVIVGSSGGDVHLLKHLKALLQSNQYLEKIIIISPSQEAFQNHSAFFNTFKDNQKTHIFCLKTFWGSEEAFDDLGLSLQEMIKMDNKGLQRVFNNK